MGEFEKIFLGSKKINFYLGDKNVTMYKGNELIYPINNTGPLKIIKVVRSSKTEYTLSGSGTGTIYVKNIDTNTITAFQHDFTKALIYPHNKGERFEFSTDGSDWRNAWGIYLNGTDAYLEALDINEKFIDAKGNRFRKLNYRTFNVNVAVFSNSNDLSTVNMQEGEQFINTTSYGARYWVGARVDGLSNFQNSHQIIVDGNENKFYVDEEESSYNYNEKFINKVTLYPFAIGKRVHSNYYDWWNTELWNIELGTHIAQMTGQGTQIIDQNGEAFLNLKGGAQWVKV